MLDFLVVPHGQENREIYLIIIHILFHIFFFSNEVKFSALHRHT